MVTLGKTLSGKTPTSGALKAIAKLEEFTINIEVTSTRNIPDPEVST